MFCYTFSESLCYMQKIFGHYFADKGLSSQSYGFSSSHVCMWKLEYKESWAPKKWCFWTVVLVKTLESLLDRKEIKPVHPKGNQSWIFIGRTDAKAETPILQPPDANNWLIGKDPDAGKDWRQEEKGTTEDEMVGWHHWLDGHEFEQALGVDDEQGSLACYSPWGHKELDMTEQLNWFWLMLYATCVYIYVCVYVSGEDPPGVGHGSPLQYSCLENPHGQRSLVSPWGLYVHTHTHTRRERYL